MCRLYCLLSILVNLNAGAATLQDDLIVDRQRDINQRVTNIVKDKDGFIWISSHLGVVRYDGRNLKRYQLTNSDIVQDEDGRRVYIRKTGSNQIWVFSDSGRIYWYDPALDIFVLKADVRKSAGITLVSDILIEKDRWLWVGTSKGLLKYDISAGKPAYVSYRKGNQVNFLCLPGNGTMLIATTKGIEIMPLKGNGGKAGTICGGINIKTIWYDQSSRLLWIGSFSSGLFVWDAARQKLADHPFLKRIPNAPVMAIRKLNNKCLLIGLDGRGIFKVDPEKQLAELFLEDDGNNNNGLKGNGIYDILVDKNRIWAGSYTGGVSLIKYNQDYQWVKHEPYNGQSVPDNHIYAILEDRDGDIWYATSSGVSLYQTAAKHWKHFFRNRNTFLTLAEDPHGRIWCGGYSTGLCYIDKSTGKEFSINSFQTNSQRECINAISIGSNGDVWAGSLYSSLTHFTVKDGKTTHTTYNVGQVRSILPLGNDTLFLGTSNGFYLFNKVTGRYKRCFGSPANYGVVSNSFIYAAAAVGDEIWFGTDGGGLNCFNRKSEKVINFSTYDGLPSNYIYGIVKDSEKLWISTGNGLFCFDPLKKKLLFKVHDLPVNEFLLMSFARFRDGRLAFGGASGAVIFDPLKLEEQQRHWPDERRSLHLTSFRLSHRTVDFRSEPDILSAAIDKTGSVELSHDQNTFSFTYVYNSLYNGDDYVYSCRLEGLDDKWISKGSSLTADYSNIPPGSYRFKVRCTTKDGGIVVGERSVNIKIKDPVWATGWAKLAYCILAALLLYWLWRYYSEKIKQRQAESRIRFFINMAHDIRTPLALISAPLNDLREEPLSAKARRYVGLAQNNAAKLNAMVSQLLDFHKAELVSGAVNLTVNEINTYLENKVMQFNSLAAEKGITLNLGKSGQAVYCETDIEKLDRIIDNLLSNAIKYSSEKGEVNITVEAKEQKVLIAVADNGIGIAKKEQKKIFNQFYRAENAVNTKETGTGIGLMYSRQLARSLNGGLSFTSAEGKGSTFFLSLPSVELKRESATDTAGSPAALSPAFETEPAAGKRYFEENFRILIVEDNDDMRAYLAHTLSEMYKLHKVASAEEALAFLQKHPVDLVLADVMMPGMHGDELCARIKSNIETSHIHVILLTAVAERDFMVHSMEHGADAYITKPFDIQALKLNIRNFLDTRKKMQQYYLTMVSLEKQNNRPGEGMPPAAKGSNIDEEFMKKCIRIVTEHIADNGFSINSLSREMAMSRTLFYEKLKVLTNQSPSELIREIRLHKAKQLLATKEYSVNEVAEMTGFTDVKYFSTLFKKYYGTTPGKVGVHDNSEI